MNKNRHELPIYKSQAQRTSLIQPSVKLYGSGATINSPHKNSSKIHEIEPCFTRRESQTQRAIDNLSTFSRQSPSFCKTNQLVRSKSGQNVKWQSPTKQTICGQSFRSIIEEINEQNDRTFSQLDQDLKRIKNNLNRIEKESVQAKQSSHCQALSEQIQILQQENQKLRQKNTALTNQKRKMTFEIQQYEALIKSEKAKLSNFAFQKPTANDSKVDDLTNNNRKLKLELEYRDSQCEKLKSQNSQLSNIKIIAQKRESMLNEEKSKLLSKIVDLQKEKDSLKLKLQEQLKTQLDKKDAYYAKIIKNQQLKYQQTISKLKANIIKSVQMKQEELNAQSSGQIEKLLSQIKKLKSSQRQLKQAQESSNEQFEELNNRIDAFKNEIQILNFSYKQSVEQLFQKEQQCKQLSIRYQMASKQSQKYSQQLQGMKQRFEQENKKNTFLQQLCNKLQHQNEQNQYQAQLKQANLADTISDQQKQLHKLRMINECAKKQNKDLQNQLYQISRQNQKCTIQLKRKTEEVISLKKENLILLTDTKNLKLQNAYSPPKQESSHELQIAQQRLHRLHSARESREQNEYNMNKEKEMMKMKKIEKQLNELTSECRAENERTKTFYKQKQNKLQEVINNQKKKIEEINSKVEQLQNQLHLKKVQNTQKQENYRQSLRKKETQFLLLQRKQAEIKLKFSILESQNSELKNRIQKIASKKPEDKIIDWQKKFQDFRSDFKKFLDVILKEVTSISENNLSDSTNIRPKDFLVGSTEFKSYEELHKIAEINYSIHTLKETIRSLNRKLKETTQTTRVSQNHQNSYLLDRSSLILEQNQKQSPPHQKRFEKSSKYFEDKNEEHQKLVLKSNELQKKCQRLIFDEKKKDKQIEELNEECRLQRRELNRLKYQSQILQDEKQDLRIKLKYCQEKLQKKEAENIAQADRDISYMTPTKETAFYRQNNFQIEKQAHQSRLRSRIRSFKSCEKRQNDLSEMRDFQKKSMQYEININKLNKLAESKSQQIEQLSMEIAEFKQKEKKAQLKYQKKISQNESLENKCEQQDKQKVKLQSKINDLELQQKILLNEIDKVQLHNREKIQQLEQFKLLLQREIKQQSIQKQVAQKKLKKELSDKQEKYSSIIQQYELKIIDLTSQSNKLKENISQMTIRYDSISQKCDQLHQQLIKKQQKLNNSDIKISELRERLEKQSKQKESMLNVFSNNTSRLTKILEEKQIQIEELKFIQESTIINLEYARNQQNRKKQNESTYSFKNQF